MTAELRDRPIRRLRPLGMLLLGSCLLAAILEGLGLPAGLLLGPMLAAILFASRGGELTLPPRLSMGAQAMIGLMIAPSLNPSALSLAVHEPWLFLGATVSTLAIAVAIGWVAARSAVLPGTVAIWGSMPGAATAMVLMARDEGTDWQLVAVMTYLRVILVAGLASLLAATVSGHNGSAHPPGGAWFPAFDLARLIETAVIATAGLWIGRLLRLSAGALLGPMILATILEVSGLAHPQLPGWLLAPSYMLVGWRIGLGFTPPIMAAARRAAPRLLLAVGSLIILCAGCGWILSYLSGIDPMTAYLATSPGGADSVAIIASAGHVDTSFVMSMQVARFVTVLVAGPALARWSARRIAMAD